METGIRREFVWVPVFSLIVNLLNFTLGGFCVGFRKEVIDPNSVGGHDRTLLQLEKILPGLLRCHERHGHGRLTINNAG